MTTERSIKRQVVYTSLAALLGALLISSLLGYITIKQEVDELFDANLIDNTRIIKGLIDTKLSQQDTDALQRSLNETLTEHIGVHQTQFSGHAYEKKIAVQVWSAEGDLILRSAGAPPHALAPLKTGLTRFEGDEYSWVVYCIWLPKTQGWLAVAERTDIRAELYRNLEASLIVSFVIALCIAIGVLKVRLRQAFAPLVELGYIIGQRHSDDLSAIELSQAPTELKPVVLELNALFVRVELSLEREKRFLADAAHELRTPLAVIKLQVEQALLQPETTYKTLYRLSESVVRSQKVVEQMLLLARLESKQWIMNLTPITLSAVLRESIAQLIPLAIKRNIDIDIALEECNVIADETLLLSLCRNILENAIRHTPDGGVVSVSLQHSEQHIIMTIIDDGTGIDPHYLGQMTNRFSQSGRGDEGAAGLGLALVAEIAAWHQLELSLQNHPQRGLMVQVKWSKF